MRMDDENDEDSNSGLNVTSSSELQTIDEVGSTSSLGSSLPRESEATSAEMLDESRPETFPVDSQGESEEINKNIVELPSIEVPDDEPGDQQAINLDTSESTDINEESKEATPCVENPIEIAAPALSEESEPMEVDTSMVETPATVSESEKIEDPIPSEITPDPAEKSLVRIPTPPIVASSTIPDIGLTAQIEAAIAQATSKPLPTSSSEKPTTNDVVELLDDDDDEEMNSDTEKPVNGDAKISDDDTKFNKHECINSKCDGKSDDFIQAPVFIVNFYGGGQNPGKVLSKRKYVCSPCYDLSVEKYQEYCTALVNQQPLLKMAMPVREFI